MGAVAWAVQLALEITWWRARSSRCPLNGWITVKSASGLGAEITTWVTWPCRWRAAAARAVKRPEASTTSRAPHRENGIRAGSGSWNSGYSRPCMRM